jgi:hypothetical protein
MTNERYLQEELRTAENALAMWSKEYQKALDNERPSWEIASYKEDKDYWAGYLGGITNALHKLNGMGE